MRPSDRQCGGKPCAQDILLLGGHNGAEWLDSMHLYTPGTGTIIDAGRMRVARGYGGAAVLGRSVYVAGGGDGSSWLRSAERYDLASRRWEAVRACVHALCVGPPPLFHYSGCCSHVSEGVHARICSVGPLPLFR
jgi:hypothetical protein